MSALLKKVEQKQRRQRRVRSKVSGTSERPRLSVFRSARHIYAQVIDDESGKTLAAASTVAKDVKDVVTEANKTDAAKKVGEAIARVCLEKGVKKVVFDRAGYMYHGRVSALAEAARKAGLEF
jgi:large subunit ribosomal protein L18